MTADAAALASALVERLRGSGLTVAVAESLTGGLVTAELIAVPGASDVVLGGVVAYRTELKHSILDVSADSLALHGPVHESVATQMAVNVRQVLAVDGRAADIGISTTGVAGPGPAGGHPAGTVVIGIAIGSDARCVRLALTGDREAIRRRVVSESLAALEERLQQL